MFFSLYSAYFSSNIWFQVFGYAFFSISVHTLCWFHLLYKGSTFQSSETAIPSYCHHPSLRRGTVWLGGKRFVLWCFPSKSNFRALLPLCAQQVLLPRLLLGFILWEAGQALPIPKCIHGHSLYLLWDCFSVPWKALQIHAGVTAILRQGVLQGNKWEQRPRRAKSWRTQFISFIHWITELLN